MKTFQIDTDLLNPSNLETNTLDKAEDVLEELEKLTLLTDDWNKM